MLEMLLSIHVPFVPTGFFALIPPFLYCWYERNVVDAPTLMRFGSVDGEPSVLVTPASPELTTTVTPAATASSSAMRTASTALSGNGFEPNDSLRTLMLCAVAQSIAWTT